MKKNFLSLLCAFTLISIFLLQGCTADNTITVMTYNIKHGAGMDNRLDLARTAKVIKLQNPDVVGLNEVDNNFSERSNFMNEAKELAEMLNMNYVYGPNLITGDPDNPNMYGNAILSKFEIKDSKNHRLYRQSKKEPRGCIEAEIDIEGQIYTFMTTHLDASADPNLRIEQVRDIIKFAETKNQRVIIMGDFNCLSPNDKLTNTEQQNTTPVALMLEKYKDTFDLAATNKEIGSLHNNKRIDYIFVSQDLTDKIISCEIINTGLTKIASDHRPVVTVIKK